MPTERSVSMRGKVEYLDPTLHVRGEGGSFAGEGHGRVRRRGVRTARPFGARRRQERRAHAPARPARAKGVDYTACPPGHEDWLLSADEITLDQRTQIGTGRGVRLDF